MLAESLLISIRYCILWHELSNVWEETLTVDTYSDWDGSTCLSECSGTGQYLGNADVLLGTIMSGRCNLSTINPSFVPVCAAAIGLPALGSSHIEGQPSMFEQIQTTFRAVVNRRSVSLTHRVKTIRPATGCGTARGASNQTRILHHIHATPAD